MTELNLKYVYISYIGSCPSALGSIYIYQILNQIIATLFSYLSASDYYLLVTSDY